MKGAHPFFDNDSKTTALLLLPCYKIYIATIATGNFAVHSVEVSNEQGMFLFELPRGKRPLR